MSIVIICVILALSPVAVYWHFRHTLRERELSFDRVKSVMPHEYAAYVYTDIYEYPFL